MGCPPRRQQLLKILGDLGVTKARHTPVDAAHVHRCCSLIPRHGHQCQPETVGQIAAILHLIDRECHRIGPINAALHLDEIQIALVVQRFDVVADAPLGTHIFWHATHPLLGLKHRVHRQQLHPLTGGRVGPGFLNGATFLQK
jgi:hypothetical protein